MSFFLCKNKPPLSFVFDIRDNSISVAVAKFEKDRKPEMILCQNFQFRYQDSRNYTKYISSMIETLDKAIISTKKDLIEIGNTGKIGTYYFFIGSPWSISQTKTIKIIKDKPFEIDNNILRKILISEELSIEKEIGKQNKESNWKVFEEKIIQSKLNGYKSNNIFGKKTLNLAIELLVSFMPYEIKNKIAFYVDEKVGKNIKKQNNSCILSSYYFLKDLYLNKNDFIYVDMGKLITDIYVVRDDIIFCIASFPFGEENIIETSLAKTNFSREIFMSHINIGQDKKFDLTSHNKGEVLLKSGFDFWENKLKYHLSQICTEINISNNLFIIPNSIISKMLARELSNKENSKQFQILGSKIEISIIKESVIDSFVSNSKAFQSEPYIKMDLIFLNKMLN